MSSFASTRQATEVAAAVIKDQKKLEDVQNSFGASVFVSDCVSLDRSCRCAVLSFIE